MSKLFYRSDIPEAAQLLRAGELVAFPTETVFGLGALANDDQAIQRVFQVKGRPGDNPLIVHVDSIQRVGELASEISPIAKQLMQTFWPGPLTIIFPVKPGIISNLVSGLPTVGIRMPDQTLTLELIRQVDFPLVGPSANLSGKPSPTQYAHVLDDFGDQIAGVIVPDTPLAPIGVESTVVALEAETIYILRPGAITAEMLHQATGAKVIEKTAKEQLSEERIASPGVKYKHYSPKQPVYIIPPDATLEQWEEWISSTSHVGVLATQKTIEALKLRMAKLSIIYETLGTMDTVSQYLYRGLRALDQSDAKIIFVESFEDDERTHAYLNRLNRAGQPAETLK